MQNKGKEQCNEARERLFADAKAAYFSGDGNHAMAMLRRWWNFEALIAETQRLPKPEALRKPSYYFGPGGSDGRPEGCDPNNPYPAGVPRKPFPHFGSGQAVVKPREPL